MSIKCSGNTVEQTHRELTTSEQFPQGSRFLHCSLCARLADNPPDRVGNGLYVLLHNKLVYVAVGDGGYRYRCTHDSRQALRDMLLRRCVMETGKMHRICAINDLRILSQPCT